MDKLKNFEKYFNEDFLVHQIIYFRDSVNNMHKVKIDKKQVMLGNYCDFYNGCNGLYDLPDFNSPEKLIYWIKKFCYLNNYQFNYNILKWNFLEEENN